MWNLNGDEKTTLPRFLTRAQYADRFFVGGDISGYAKLCWDIPGDIEPEWQVCGRAQVTGYAKVWGWSPRFDVPVSDCYPEGPGPNDPGPG